MYWSFDVEGGKWGLIGGAIGLLGGTIAYLVNRRLMSRDERKRLLLKLGVSLGSSGAFLASLYLLWRFGLSANTAFIPIGLYLAFNLWLWFLPVRRRNHE